MGLTISRSMVVFGAVVCSGFMIVVGLSGVALGQLKVTGPLYERIASGKDLLGDILPPPEYVIEAYLEANLAAQDPARLPEHEARLARLRQDYEQRRAYWKASLIPADLKRELTETSDTQVRRFWDQLDAEVVPAIRRRDPAAISAAMGGLGRTYAQHRRLIDDVVARATAMDAGNERSARALVARYTALMFGGAGLVAVALVAGLIVIARRVTRPIAAMKTYMGALAGGDYSREPPFAERTDEIGEMAASVAVFRTAVLERQAARQAEMVQATEAERVRARDEAERAEL
ncbi:MAG: HAMP domain-containing protein, partial [Caulobacteraceae bacterium]